jgi:hypothetical protein
MALGVAWWRLVAKAAVGNAEYALAPRCAASTCSRAAQTRGAYDRAWRRRGSGNMLSTARKSIIKINIGSAAFSQR